MDELAKKVAEMSGKYGASISEAALQAARTAAYSCLAGSVLWAAAAVGMVLAGLFLYRKSHEPEWSGDWVAAAFLLWFVALFPASVALWAWVDPWTWTTIYHPELWVAKKAFGL